MSDATGVHTDYLHLLIENRELPELSEICATMPTWEIVDAFDEIPTRDAAVLFRLLDKSKAIEIFDDLDTAAQADLVAELSDAKVSEVFAGLEPDEQARLLDELPARVAKKLMTAMTAEDHGQVTRLLGYPRDSVGRTMEPAVYAKDHETVDEVLHRIRSHHASLEALAEIPVVSDVLVLVGKLNPIDLVRSDGNRHVAELMEADPPYAYTSDDAEVVARRVLDSGDLLFPIVDAEKRLVGVFPIGDAAALDKRAVAEDSARAGGAEPLRRPYLLTPVATVAKSRVVWLLVLAVSAVLTVQVLEIFEETLSQVVALALFIPLLTGIGGNTGSQAATTVTRALSLGNVRKRDFVKVAFKELRTGILLGIALGALAFVVASLVYGVGIGTVVGVTIILNCPIAATVGGLVPLVAQACKVDPAVFSTPFISTFCDATGLLLYFTVAITVLGL